MSYTHLLDYTTYIAKIKIEVFLSNHLLVDGEIMKKNQIPTIVKKEFNKNYSFEENAMQILNTFQPFCYEVKITPPAVGYRDYYTVRVRKG